MRAIAIFVLLLAFAASAHAHTPQVSYGSYEYHVPTHWSYPPSYASLPYGSFETRTPGVVVKTYEREPKPVPKAREKRITQADAVHIATSRYNRPVWSVQDTVSIRHGQAEPVYAVILDRGGHTIMIVYVAKDNGEVLRVAYERKSRYIR